MIKTFKMQAAQGDILMRRIEKLPEELTEAKLEGGKYILAKSETGHNHTVRKREGVKFYTSDNDQFLAYLVVDNTKCFVEHERSFDTHEPIELSPGIYEVRRQREYHPQGWRRAQD